jgi:hypothetical protein
MFGDRDGVSCQKRGGCRQPGRMARQVLNCSFAKPSRPQPGEPKFFQVASVGYHRNVMKRTTVYLTEDELDRLRRAALETGRLQADLIREGVHRVTEGQSKRQFRSRALGRGTGEPVAQEFEMYLRQAVAGRSDSDR